MLANRYETASYVYLIKDPSVDTKEASYITECVSLSTPVTVFQTKYNSSCAPKLNPKFEQ